MHTYDFHISTIIIVPTCPSIWLETTSKKSLLWILLFQSLFSLFSLKFDDKFCDTSYNCFLSAWTAECSASQSWIMRAHPPKAGRRNRRTKHTTRFKVKRGKVSVAEPGGIKNPARLSTVRESSNSPTSKQQPVESMQSQHDAILIRKLQQQNTRAAKTTFLIVPSFVVCWLSHSYLSIMYNDILCRKCAIDIKKHPELGTVLPMLSYLNSAINPVLYSFPSSEFKKATKDFISRRRPSQGVQIQTENTRAMEGRAATL